MKVKFLDKSQFVKNPNNKLLIMCRIDDGTEFGMTIGGMEKEDTKENRKKLIKSMNNAIQIIEEKGIKYYKEEKWIQKLGHRQK